MFPDSSFEGQKRPRKVNTNSTIYCRQPTDLDTITIRANTAVEEDTQGDADELLQAIRVVSSQMMNAL